MRLVSELRRRNVLRMLVLYVVAAWLIMQVAEVVIGLAKLPDWFGPGVRHRFPDRNHVLMVLRANAGRREARKGY